jgi:hypothetical protein
MKYLKQYEQYIKESITTDVDGLLDSIKEKKVDFFSLGLSNDDYINETIDKVYDDANFNKQLFKKNLKKGELESTMDIENFLRKDIDMKFFFLYNRNETVLDDPNYLILQYYKDEKWHPIEIYSIRGAIEKFYEKLTAKTIKLTFDNVTYIYNTSNSGNNWLLKDKQKKNNKFKENLETEDIKNLIRDGAKLKIIE